MARRIEKITHQVVTFDPTRFQIHKHKFIAQSLLVVDIQYQDCPIEGGRMVLVFESAFRARILERECMDPDFSASHDLLARFPGTQQGWDDASDYAAFRALKHLLAAHMGLQMPVFAFADKAPRA